MFLLKKMVWAGDCCPKCAEIHQSALGGMVGGGLWSGVPVVAVILAVTLSPDSCLLGTGSLSRQGSLLYLWWSLRSRPSRARPCPQGPLLSLWCVLPCFFPTDHSPPSGGQTDPFPGEGSWHVFTRSDVPCCCQRCREGWVPATGGVLPYQP